jgi:hypothetical protein
VYDDFIVKVGGEKSRRPDNRRQLPRKRGEFFAFFDGVEKMRNRIFQYLRQKDV